ncbi:MAG: aminomethyltransferase family protein [Gemmatimonadota bacterium]|nr:MAG: aminomethyltransferase family protein [Gemmatimonadota bacterium]
MEAPLLRGTPLHPRTSQLCQAQNWRRWAGYVVAGSYELLHEREYFAIRTTAALIDVSPLYKYQVTGPDAERFLNRLIPRDVERCAVHQVLYTPWCDDAGKVIDDGTVARLDPDAFRLTSGEPNLRWLQDVAAGLAVTIGDISESLAALALQGPASREILQRLSDASLADLRFFRLTHALVAGIPTTITRTGYTGDLGYELWVEPDQAIPLWDRLTDAGAGYGLLPAGMLALDVARIEAGLPLIDVDYIPSNKALIEQQKSSPYELDLGWTVRLDKGPFVGRQALVAEEARGPAWRFTGLEVAWDSIEGLYAELGLPPALPLTAWRVSVPVYSKGEQVGYATSGCWSPILKRYIALAHLRSAWAEPGTELEMEVTVEHRRRRAAVRVVRKPFFDPPRKRALPGAEGVRGVSGSAPASGAPSGAGDAG